MENWALEPEVLRVYAKHYKTGERIPTDLVEKIRESAQFNQGFITVEYLAASMLDMDWHTLTAPTGQDAAAFEKASMEKIGNPPAIPPRYRSPYYSHIFAGGYSAGYYAYIWAEVLTGRSRPSRNRPLRPGREAFPDRIREGRLGDAMTMYSGSGEEAGSTRC